MIFAYATLMRLFPLPIERIDYRTTSLQFWTGNNGKNGNQIVFQLVIYTQMPLHLASQTGTTGSRLALELVDSRVWEGQRISHSARLEPQREGFRDLRYP